MISNQKQSTFKSTETHEDFLKAFEEQLQRMDQVKGLEIMLKQLQYLGLNYDPFSGVVSSECQQVMDKLGLAQHLMNPYLATNILLRLLDKTEERLNNLKQ